MPAAGPCCMMPWKTACTVRSTKTAGCASGWKQAVCGEDLPDAPAYIYGDKAVWQPVAAQYAVSYRRHGESDFLPLGVTEAPQPVGAELAPQIDRLRYEFTLPAQEKARTLLELGRVGEISEL